MKLASLGLTWIRVIQPSPGFSTPRRPSMQLTTAFLVLLQEFAPVFTQPSFDTFKALLTGWCLSFRPRFITELILASGSTHNGHHSCYHRFFSAAVWSLEYLWFCLDRLLLATFAPSGPIELAG